MNNDFRVYIGYDTREDMAYQVCKFSIEQHSPNAKVYPLKQSTLRDQGWYHRGNDKLASTEFTFTRFLVPELANFDGWAVFMDCDMLLTTDIAELFAQADDTKAIMCVQHNYEPKEGIKMDGQVQTVYPRKNWSSMMLINCGHPANKRLTMDLVNEPEINGAYLHRFSWLESDDLIGEISPEWNWLVGHYKEPKDGTPKLLHYTEGGPWFENYRHCQYNQLWKHELQEMMNE